MTYEVAVSPTPDDVYSARRQLAGRLVHTPVLTNPELDAATGLSLHFKCENLQHTGSFKLRGATNALMCLLESSGPRVLERGVATHSSGNHGAALAVAARRLDIPVRVVVPDNAPPGKCRAIADAGAQVIRCGPALADREGCLGEVIAATGAWFVPPYNDAAVIAGQATATLELLETVPDLAEIWVPVGGGGLASGAVLAVTGHHRGNHGGTRVMGAEPRLADDAYRSLQSGVLQPALAPRTIADGLRTARGEVTFEILRGYGLRIERVSEEEISLSQRTLWNHLRIVVEPSGGVSFAGLLRRAKTGIYPSGARIGVVLSGGNVEFVLP